MNSFQIDFAIVGQPKSGTTALAEFLSSHPEICISLPKEPNYFATDFIKESDEYHGAETHFKIRSLEDYQSVFKHKKDGQIIGEATTSYMYSRDAAQNLAKHNPDCRIIIMLRHPVDFLHSLHNQYVNVGAEKEGDFKKVVEIGEKREPRKNINLRCPSYLHYLERAKYFEQLERYYGSFSENNILVLTHEEFRKDNLKTYKKVLNFLGVSNEFIPEFKRLNASRVPRSKKLARVIYTPQLRHFARRILSPKLYKKTYIFIHKMIYKKSKRDKLDEEFRRQLAARFYEDVQKSSRLVGKDLAKEWGYK